MADNKLVWNNNFVVSCADSEQVLLKHDLNGAVILLSEAEYRVIRLYSERNDYSYVQQGMTDYCLEETILDKLIGKAEAMEVLHRGTPSSNVKKRSMLHAFFYYIGLKFVQLLSFCCCRAIRPEFCGNLRFFKLFSFDLQGSRLQRVATSRTFIKWAVLFYVLSSCLLLVNLFLPHSHFRFSGFGMQHPPVFLLFLAIMFSIFCCLFVHETGHYLVYKHFGGLSDRMGVGTMFLVFPVMYTQIDHLHLWNNKRKKMLLSAAGILMDSWLLLLLSNVISLYHATDFLSLLVDCLFYYYLVQLFCNLNFLFPGTDGYYLFEDLLGKERLLGKSYETSLAFWNELKSGEWVKKSFKEWLRIAYFCSSCACISIYWLAITLVLTFPLWSERFLNTF